MSYMNRTSMLDEMLHNAPCATFDIENVKPGMKLQRLEQRVWVDYQNDGKEVKSPVDLNKLPPGNYRLV